MATTEHKHPNYMAIFWYLAVLTVVEIAVTPLAIATLLVFVILPDGFAVAKRTEGVKAEASAPAKH